MERIQTAIAKGRAARQQLATIQPAKLPVAKEDNRVAAAWAALGEAPFNRQVFEEARIVAHVPGPAATAFDLVRTNMMRHLRENSWTRVAITSPSGGCGKSTTCLNLAFSLARQTELRIVVLDLDLRRPNIMRALGLSRAPHLPDVLSGEEPPEHGLVRIGANLAFGVNTKSVANSAEILSSTQTGTAIDAIEERFRPDVMLFDMPPVLVTDDTLSFLDQVDCALMIAASEQSTVAEIDRAGKELADHTAVLGVVLNKCRYMDEGDGYGYDYSPR